MRKNLLLFVAACATVFFVCSCGGGGPAGKSKLLGRVPALLEQFKQDKESFNAKFKACDSENEFIKLMEQGKKVEEKFEAEMAKENEALAGTAIPYEIDPALPLKMSVEPTITEVRKDGGVSFQCELEFINDVTISSREEFLLYGMKYEFIGAENAVLNSHSLSLTGQTRFVTGGVTIPAGTKVVVQQSIPVKREPGAWKSFEKIVFSPK